MVLALASGEFKALFSVLLNDILGDVFDDVVERRLSPSFLSPDTMLNRFVLLVEGGVLSVLLEYTLLLTGVLIRVSLR